LSPTYFPSYFPTYFPTASSPSTVAPTVNGKSSKEGNGVANDNDSKSGKTSETNDKKTGTGGKASKDSPDEGDSKSGKVQTLDYSTGTQHIAHNLDTEVSPENSVTRKKQIARVPTAVFKAKSTKKEPKEPKSKEPKQAKTTSPPTQKVSHNVLLTLFACCTIPKNTHPFTVPNSKPFN
jgi:hypothetical protein